MRSSGEGYTGASCNGQALGVSRTLRCLGRYELVEAIGVYSHNYEGRFTILLIARLISVNEGLEHILKIHFRRLLGRSNIQIIMKLCNYFTRSHKCRL